MKEGGKKERNEGRREERKEGRREERKEERKEVCYFNSPSPIMQCFNSVSL